MEVKWFLCLSMLTCIFQGRTEGKYVQCERIWKKVGCFRDKESNRALPNEVLNYRDKHNKHYEGTQLSWQAFPESTLSLVCECAEKATEAGYSMFGIQYFGECWTGPGSEERYDMYGSSNKCKGVDYQSCDDDSESECVGAQLSNYVYELHTDEIEPVDGGYSEWSQWTKCSATCGTGHQHRFRSCSNPEPKHGGKDCSSLGEPEELKDCNCFDCNQACRMAMDFGIIVDTSGSVGRRNFLKIKDMLYMLIHDFDISDKETHVALITYSTDAKLQFNFDTYYDSHSMIDHIRAMNEKMKATRTDKAIQLAVKELFSAPPGYRPEVPNVLVIITDGRTNPNSKPYDEVLQPLKKLGVTTIAVGVGKRTKESELLEIAMGKIENVIHMDSYDELKERLHDMMGRICASIRANASP